MAYWHAASPQSNTVCSTHASPAPEILLSVQPIFAAFQYALEKGSWPRSVDGAHQQAEWMQLLCDAYEECILDTLTGSLLYNIVSQLSLAAQRRFTQEHAPVPLPSNAAVQTQAFAPSRAQFPAWFAAITGEPVACTGGQALRFEQLAAL